MKNSDAVLDAKNDAVIDAAIDQAAGIKRNHGRYTLEEAAAFISERTGEDAKGLTNRFIAAVKNGELARYKPFSFVKMDSPIVRVSYEHVYWNDLNEWLEKNEPRLECKFPQPIAEVSPGETATSTQDKPQKPQGHTWRDIMDAPWPGQQGFNLAAALSNKIPKWLDNETAIMHRGTAPEPTLWNPAGIAICMATDAPRRKWTMQPKALDNVIRARFPEFLQEWEAFLRDR